VSVFLTSVVSAVKQQRTWPSVCNWENLHVISKTFYWAGRNGFWVTINDQCLSVYTWSGWH